MFDKLHKVCYALDMNEDMIPASWVADYQEPEYDEYQADLEEGAYEEYLLEVAYNELVDMYRRSVL